MTKTTNPESNHKTYNNTQTTTQKSRDGATRTSPKSGVDLSAQEGKVDFSPLVAKERQMVTQEISNSYVNIYTDTAMA